MALTTEPTETALKQPKALTSAYVIPIRKNRSRQPKKEELVGYNLPYFNNIIIPPLDPYSDTIPIFENSEILPQCVRAKVQSIIGYGYTFQEKSTKESFREDNREAIEAERKRIEGFSRVCNDNNDNITTLSRKLVDDLNTFGYGGIEVVRDGFGEIKWIYHVPAAAIRIGRTRDEWVDYEVKIIEDFVIRKEKRKKKFRFYAVEGSIFGDTTTYFKEFGDPRIFNSRTGELIDFTKKEKIPPADEWATEIIFFEYGYPKGHAYPKPPWFGAASSLIGVKRAQEANNEYLTNGHLENSMLFVSGQINTEAIKSLEDQLDKYRGIGSIGKMIIFQVESQQIDVNAPLPKFQPLTDNLLQDGIFMKYKEECRNDVLSAMQVPAILVARSSDYNKATSQQAMVTFEQSVCAPDRSYLELIFTTTVFADMGMRYHAFKFNTPNLTDPLSISRMVEIFNRVGAMTPNEGRRVWNEVANGEMPIIEEIWGNMPFVPYKPIDDPFGEQRPKVTANQMNGKEPASNLMSLPGMEPPPMDNHTEDIPEDTRKVYKEFLLLTNEYQNLLY